MFSTRFSPFGTLVYARIAMFPVDPQMLPVTMALLPITYTLPATVSLSVGLVFAIPTKPFDVIRTLSVFFVLNLIF